MRIERLHGTVEAGLTNGGGAPVHLRAQVYSAVMDAETCDACAMWDGAEGAFDATGVRYAARAPNHLCTTVGGCRCAWVYIGADEAPVLLPASKTLPLFGSV
jgi:hypothetical protein